MSRLRSLGQCPWEYQRALRGEGGCCDWRGSETVTVTKHGMVTRPLDARWSVREVMCVAVTDCLGKRWVV